ncbi:LacI family DNA-binding transcriptional regulator [Lichenicoccus roseus]|uniref:LacI family DNA-binding transcriptional regulator n=1 Tax=Lichenicoccus roseus TaxID=2683649 RepID=A0A5R9J6E4_9PROT|nr:LacI family DNA-binding transcriptional regulator [Lichenicoccus roseus]TLU72067.1 LacI family DNA-binding transcriptional regulator [Lichenicoccus roseus]
MDIKALARHLDLSIGTVSRALNDRKDVRDATRLRVREAAAAMGYAPNHSGRALRRGRTNAIAFVLRPSVDSASHGDPFFMALFDGIQHALAGAGLDLIVLLPRRDEDQLAFLVRAVSRGLADGWLLSATTRHDERIPFLLERGVPFATLGRSLSGGAQSWIDLDFETMVTEAVRRLAARGHRRIAAIEPGSDINLGHVVEECWRNALVQAGLDPDPDLLVRVEPDEAGGHLAAGRLLDLPRPPTAAVLTGETTPIGVYRALRERGLTPGRNFAVIATGDAPACRALSPALTRYTCSLHDLGMALAASLLARLDPDADPEPVQQLWPMRLVEGASDG